jgi:predicted outer membrane lipoprotein
MPKHAGEVMKHVGDAKQAADTTPLADSLHPEPTDPNWDDIILRLGLAAVFGLAAALAYFLTQRKKRSEAASFVATMVLLSILLGMVSMVIGSNIARAFALVGALSIVRFRTVVEDTRDTAFVIFAVVVGMAAGAGAYLVAAVGIPIVGLVAGLLSWWGHSGEKKAVPLMPLASRTTLVVRVGTGVDVPTSIATVIAKHADDVQHTAVATVRQGIALDLTYSLRLRAGVTALTLVGELNRTEGVQAAEWKVDS